MKSSWDLFRRPLSQISRIGGHSNAEVVDSRSVNDADSGAHGHDAVDGINGCRRHVILVMESLLAEQRVHHASVRGRLDAFRRSTNS